MSKARLISKVLETEDALEAIEYCFEQGWTDGLPVVPPTEAKVQAMLDYVGLEPSDLLGVIPPKEGLATAEKLAINAVMAGCLPSSFPVVLAAVQAMLEEPFNLNGVQATTHNVAPLLIINGPIRQELNINSGSGVFGQGWRANATIGRAIRLILMNIGGGIPGTTDKSTLGHPGKYTYCIAENEEANPWEPLHVERGFDRQQSTVTVFGGEAPHLVVCKSSTPENILLAVADVMATLGNNNLHHQGQVLVVLTPDHIEKIVQHGWSKADVKAYLFEKARRPLRDLLALERGEKPYILETYAVGRWPEWLNLNDENERIPVVDKPDDIIVIVAGGPGIMSAVVPGWGDLGGFAVTKGIGSKN